MEDFANLITMDTKHRKAVCMGLNGRKGQIRLHIWWKWFWLHTGDNDYVKHTKPKVIHHRCFSTWKDVASLSWSKEVIQDGILNLCKVLMSTETVNKRTCKTLTWHNGTRSLQRCLWLHFLSTVYCRACNLPLRVVCSPSETPLERTKLVFSSVSIGDSFWARDGACVRFFLQFQDPLLVQTCVCSAFPCLFLLILPYYFNFNLTLFIFFLFLFTR